MVIIKYSTINLLPLFRHYSQLCHYSVPVVMTASGTQLYQNQAKTAGIFQATRFALWNVHSMPFAMAVSIAWSHSELDHR